MVEHRHYSFSPLTSLCDETEIGKTKKFIEQRCPNSKHMVIALYVSISQKYQGSRPLTLIFAGERAAPSHAPPRSHHYLKALSGKGRTCVTPVTSIEIIEDNSLNFSLILFRKNYAIFSLLQPIWKSNLSFVEPPPYVPTTQHSHGVFQTIKIWHTGDCISISTNIRIWNLSTHRSIERHLLHHLWRMRRSFLCLLSLFFQIVPIKLANETLVIVFDHDCTRSNASDARSINGIWQWYV